MFSKCSAELEMTEKPLLGQEVDKNDLIFKKYIARGRDLQEAEE